MPCREFASHPSPSGLGLPLRGGRVLWPVVPEGVIQEAFDSVSGVGHGMDRPDWTPRSGDSARRSRPP